MSCGRVIDPGDNVRMMGNDEVKNPTNSPKPPSSPLSAPTSPDPHADGSQPLEELDTQPLDDL